ncbi:MAG: cupin domain-containing protein [Bacteroidota bacterium]
MLSKPITDIIPWNKKTKPTLEELKRILKAGGQECDLYSDPPGMKYGRHRHDFDDFVVIVSGKMKIGTDTGTWVLKPGDRLDLPANTIHWAEVMGKEEVKYLSAAK